MLDWWWLSAHHKISHNHDLPIKITLCSAGRAYRSRCVAAGSGPRGSDTSPYGPAAGSRSSSPGSPWREERAPSAESSLVRSGTVRRSIITDILNRKIHQTDNFSAVSSISLAISFLPPSLIYFLCGFIVSLLPPSFLPLLLLLTHSSDSRSLVSFSLSLKQPRECMLSRTSGSISSAVASVLMATFLGTGCSGSGSFFPALQHDTCK